MIGLYLQNRMEVSYHQSNGLTWVCKTEWMGAKGETLPGGWLERNGNWEGVLSDEKHGYISP